jgi:hypothetical protein
MRKLIAVGVLVGGLLAGAGSAMAQQAGIGDPLTLAASGVLIPFVTGSPTGTVALIEVASPVGANGNLHMLFYNTNCARVGDSVGIPETVNDIAFQDPTEASNASSSVISGLVAIAGVDATGFILQPLDNPIHARVYEFTPTDGRSRVFEPIILDTAEYPGDPHTWSPMRTAATFYAPLETDTIHTELTLICPRSTIQGASGAAFGSGTTPPFSSTGFPVIAPPFKTIPLTDDMRARIYDTNEVLKRDVRFDCDCLTANLSVLDISSFYGNTTEAAAGTYTEVEINTLVNSNGSFTGYRAVFAEGSNLNNFWGRLSNGNRLSIQGTLTNDR